MIGRTSPTKQARAPYCDCTALRAAVKAIMHRPSHSIFVPAVGVWSSAIFEVARGFPPEWRGRIIPATAPTLILCCNTCAKICPTHNGMRWAFPRGGRDYYNTVADNAQRQ